MTGFHALRSAGKIRIWDGLRGLTFASSVFFFSLPLPSWRLARLKYQFDTSYLDKGHGVKEAFFGFFFPS